MKWWFYLENKIRRVDEWIGGEIQLKVQYFKPH